MSRAFPEEAVWEAATVAAGLLFTAVSVAVIDATGWTTGAGVGAGLLTAVEGLTGDLDGATAAAGKKKVRKYAHEQKHFNNNIYVNIRKYLNK